MRSLLFVPGDSERKQEKGLGSEADALIVDLEDSVAPPAKAAARLRAAEFLAAQRGRPGPLLFVRVNDLSTGLTDDDLADVMPHAPHAILLPKSNGAEDVARLSAKLRVHEARAGLADGATRIMALVTETAVGLLSVRSYASPDPRLTAVTWGAEDLSAAVGARASRDASGAYTDLFRLARAMTLLAASAAEVQAVDTVYPDFRDLDGFRRECEAAERDGFTACMAIHPAQVPVINEVYTPSPEAVAQAEAIVAEFVRQGDAGVVAIDGKMYDRPHLRQAERLLARAAARHEAN